jgi:hypothetical protein
VGLSDFIGHNVTVYVQGHPDIRRTH